MAGGITFDGNSLQTANIFTQNISHSSLPSKNAPMYALAHANKSVIPFVSYPSRVIRVTGQIIGTSSADLESKLDTFKSYLTGTDKNLDIDYAGGTRRYIATVTASAIDQPGGLNHADFSIDFACTQPFGQATTSTTALSASGRTSQNYSDNHTFIGTAPFQLPVITITYTASAAGPNAVMSFGNNANGQAIYITYSFDVGDVLVIDCLNRTVTINGVDADFEGAFPEFAPGAQTMSYNDYFGSSAGYRTFTISVIYYALYL